MPDPTICPDCVGGYRDDVVCTTCISQGTLPIGGEKAYFKDQFADLMDKVADIKEKVDEIKAVVDAL